MCTSGTRASRRRSLLHYDMRYGFFTLSLIFSVTLTSLQAQQPDSLAIAIDEVVVTGTGTEHYFKEAPVQTEVITSRMLRNYSGRSLADILSGLSPSFDFSHSDMGAGLNMGGLGNAYVLILLNGKRLHGDLGGQNDLGQIDPDDIERIEIVRGASSSLYGSDAIAGVVNIITRRHRDIPLVVENTSRLGSYFDLQQHNTVAFSVGRLTSTTKSSLQHTNGWQNTTQEWYRDHLYENSTTQTVSAFWSERVEQELAWASRDKRWDLSVSGMYYRKLLVHRAGSPRWRAFNPLYHDQGYSASARFRPSAKTTLTLDASLDRHVYLYDYYNRYIDEFIRPVVVDGDIVRVPLHVVYFPGDRSTESDQRRWAVHGKGVFKRLGAVNFFILFLWLVLPFSFSYPGETVAALGPLEVTRQGLELALLLTIKGNAVALGAIAFFGKSSVYELSAAALRLGAPEKMTAILVLMFRYIQVIGQEYARLRLAMKARGFRPAMNMHSYRSYAGLIGMLLVRSLDRAARIHAAMRCRGYNGRLWLSGDFRFKKTDWALSFLMIFMMGGVLSFVFI